MSSSYQRLIREIAPAGPNPAAVEAWMRAEFGTLDHLPRSRFASAAKEAEGIGRDFLRQLAESYGLGKDHASWEALS